MAGGFGTTFANHQLLLWFNGTAIADLAENDTSSPATSLYLSLHTATPGGTASQADDEITYTSYVRKQLSRATGAGGFTVTNATMALGDATVSFAAGTGGSGTATHIGIGTNGTAGQAGYLMFWGTVTPNIVCGNGVTPQITNATFITLGTT